MTRRKKKPGVRKPMPEPSRPFSDKRSAISRNALRRFLKSVSGMLADRRLDD